MVDSNESIRQTPRKRRGRGPTQSPHIALACSNKIGQHIKFDGYDCAVGPTRAYNGKSKRHRQPSTRKELQILTQQVKQMSELIGKMQEQIAKITSADVAQDQPYTQRVSTRESMGEHTPSVHLSVDVCSRLKVVLDNYGENLLPPMPWEHTRVPVENDQIPREELMTLVRGGEELDYNILSVWCSYIHNMCSAYESTDTYGLIDLAFTTTYRFDPVHIRLRILELMRMQPNKRCYLVPMLTDGHFQLVVLCPGNNQIVFFCSLGRAPTQAMSNAMEMVMCDFCNSRITPIWAIPESYRQLEHWECGYYVMKWMDAIVFSETVDNWEIAFADGQRNLSRREIDDIRRCWATYFEEIVGFI